MLTGVLRLLLMQICCVGSVYGAASVPESIIVARACVRAGSCTDMLNYEAFRELLHAVSGNTCDEHEYGIRNQPDVWLETLRIITQRPLEDNPVLVPVIIANQAGKTYQMDSFHWQRRGWQKFPELLTSSNVALCIPQYIPFGWLLQAQQAHKGKGFVQEIDVPLAHRTVTLKLKTEPFGSSGLPFMAHAAYAVAHYLALHRKVSGAELSAGLIESTGQALLWAEQFPSDRGMMAISISGWRVALAQALKKRAEVIIKNCYGVDLNLPEWHTTDAALLKQFCLKG